MSRHGIEVEGGHIGLGWNRDVFAAPADRFGLQAGPSRQHVFDQ
ncbi:hypothetical protein [Uliginosibacterium flavum]|uniref:Uncharacterized protein n=1 Tax=Uliginosibacterium flavum TaxID=1396831 RepID=A0ABV2THC5_9RHOO